MSFCLNWSDGRLAYTVKAVAKNPDGSQIVCMQGTLKIASFDDRT